MNMDWMVYFTAIMSCLFAISEALAVIPSIKANSIFQLVVNIIKMILGKK